MSDIELLPEVARLILRSLETAELLRLSTVSRSFQALVCSVIKARMLGLLHAPKHKVVLFESSSPASPATQLSHRLLFQGFYHSGQEESPSRMIASFGFCDEAAVEAHPCSTSMSFDLDPTASFETLLLSVRLQPVSNGQRDARREVEVAEGLERFWRAWFEEPVDRQLSAVGKERGRQVERPLPPGDAPALSQRTVSIDKTIAQAHVLLQPFATVKTAASISRDRRAHLGDVTNRGTQTCTIAWKSVDLNVARVVVEHELAEKRRAAQIVLFWGAGSSQEVQRQD